MSEPRKRNVSYTRKVSYKRIIYCAMGLLIFFLVGYGVSIVLNDSENISDAELGGSSNFMEDTIELEEPTEPVTYPDVHFPDNYSGDIKPFGEDIVSKSGVLINVTDNVIVAGRDANKRMYPASMTKVMTLIVAVENMVSLDDTFTMTEELLIPLVDAEASRAGFDPGETVTMEDLLYGAVLPSGADATVGLAVKLCGSEENFVKLMNEKCEYMGLKDTHFCNTSGLHDEQHYSTPVEMGMIMAYAMQNDVCRKVLSTYQYTTSKTPKHPKGIELTSTMFGRMYGDEVQKAVIQGGKTGYTDEAMHCLATFGTKEGKDYVTVTALSYDYWLTIYDAFNLYASYIEPKTEIVLRPE